MPGIDFAFIVGWAVALLLALLLVIERRKLIVFRQKSEMDAAAMRDASVSALEELSRSLETTRQEARELGAALSDFSAHVAVARVANASFLDEMHRRLLDRLNTLKKVFDGLAPAKLELEVEIKATTLHDRRERFSQHVAGIIESEAYLNATIPLREQDLELLGAFRTKLTEGRFDEAIEESNLEKLRQLLQRLEQEKRRALLEGINRPGHLEFSKALKFRDALEKTLEEKRLEAEIKAQKARSIVDD